MFPFCSSYSASSSLPFNSYVVQMVLPAYIPVALRVYALFQNIKIHGSCKFIRPMDPSGMGINMEVILCSYIQTFILKLPLCISVCLVVDTSN